jgi:hypothetical protein
MKGIDGRAVGSAKAEMPAGNGHPPVDFASDGEFHAE